MKAGYTDIVMVLDRSGSMASIADDTIGGFNTFVEEQKKVPGEATLSLIQFDDQYELVHDAKRIADIPALDRKTFVPRASTALLDAIGRTIEGTGKRLADMPEANRPEKVVFVIITDGQENASREWDRNKVFAAITRQRDTYNWQFVFLGANQDAIAEATKLGVAAGSSMTYAANAVGTRSSLQAVGNNVRNFRTGVVKSADFTDDDRAKQAAAMTTP